MVVAREWRSTDRQMVIAAALLLVAAALYILQLNRMIRYDEAYTLRHYATSPIQALLAYTLPNNHLLNSLAIWASTRIVGMSEVAVRFPAMIWAVLSVALIYRIGRRLDNREGHNIGILAAAILATYYTYAYYATYARGYTLSILLTLAITEHLLWGRERRRYGLLLCGMAIMMVMPSNVLLVGAAGLWLLWQRRLQEAVALGVGAVAGFMWYVPALLMFWSKHDTAFGLATPGELLAQWIAIMTPAQGLVLLLVGAVVGLVSRPASPLRSWVLLALLVAVVLVPVQYWLSGNLFYARNYLYLLPLLALSAASGVMVVLRWQPGVALAAALVVLQTPMISTISQPGPENALLDKVRASEDAVLLSCCIEEPVWYYLAEDQHERFVPGSGEFVVIVDRTYSTLEDVLDMYQIEGVTCAPESGWVFEAWRCVSGGG